MSPADEAADAVHRTAAGPNRLLVLLTGAHDRADDWAGVRTALGERYRVLTPRLPGLDPLPDGPLDLAGAAASVAGAVEEAGLGPAVVCGRGVGAMVGLRLALDQPDRVARLVLLTSQVQVAPLIRSLPGTVVQLLPAATVQRLGAGPQQVLAQLDQVRPVDFARIARQVDVPARVLCGGRDRINRRASAALARALPRGELVLLGDAGPHWYTEHPQLLSEAIG